MRAETATTDQAKLPPRRGGAWPQWQPQGMVLTLRSASVNAHHWALKASGTSQMTLPTWTGCKKASRSFAAIR